MKSQLIRTYVATTLFTIISQWLIIHNSAF